MIRLVALLVVAFALPFVAHALATFLGRRPVRFWPEEPARVAWLIAFGLTLALITLLLLINGAPNTLGERYVPAHMEGTTLVPGRFEPAQ